jgi:NADH-quinone oxidoreductase subunit J
MIYVFAIQLVSKQALQGLTERLKGSRVIFGAILSLIGCATVILVLMKNQYLMAGMMTPDVEVPMKSIGMALVGAGKYQYVLAFEFISLFLLACIIGGLVVSRKEEEK